MFSAAVGGVHDFGGADGCEIAALLIGDDDSSGTGALMAVAEAGARP